MHHYRNQHFVPAVYLSRFGEIYNDKEPRKTVIWAYDVARKASRDTSVEAVCFQKYFYDKNDPKESESDLKILEDAYGAIIGKLLNKESVTDVDLYRLFQFAILLHVRNPSFRNPTETPRIEHVRNAFATSLVNFLAKNDSEFHLNWLVSPIDSASGAFLTSDNPCVFYRDKASEFAINAIPRLVYLPVTPFNALVFVRKPWRIISQTASIKDMENLGGSISSQRNQYLFTPTDQKDHLHGDLDKIVPVEDRGYFIKDKMRTNHWIMDRPFSFLQEPRNFRNGWISAALLEVCRSIPP